MLLESLLSYCTPFNITLYCVLSALPHIVMFNKLKWVKGNEELNS